MFFSTCDCCIILKLAMSQTCLDTVHLLPNPASEKQRKDIESLKGVPNLLLSTRQRRWAINMITKQAVYHPGAAPSTSRTESVRCPCIVRM